MALPNALLLNPMFEMSQSNVCAVDLIMYGQGRAQYRLFGLQDQLACTDDVCFVCR